MAADEAETTNLAEQHPEIIQRLAKLMKKYVLAGRSTTGVPQRNDVEELWHQLDWMTNY
jgi:hypothetical protein